jgi:hypothetical protein
MYPDGEPSETEEEPPASNLKSAIRSFRVGEFLFSARPQPDDDSGDGAMAQAQVRLFSEKGTAEGEILAEKKDNRWYISGITVDFAGLFLSSKKSDEVFDPGSPVGPGL